MTGRARLANRRRSETFEFRCDGLDFSATIARYRDGGLAEIFLASGKVGSGLDAAAKDAAVVASLALQFGAPVETIKAALLRDARGIPASPLGVALDLISEVSE